MVKSKEASLEAGLYEPERVRKREEGCLTKCRKYTGKITFEFYTSSSTEPDDSLPRQFVLQQNHPNTFNPRTTITYHLEKENIVHLKIFDLAGRMIAVLVDGDNQASGKHTTTWMGRDLHGRAMPSGTYFYRLIAGRNTETKRMLLIR